MGCWLFLQYVKERSFFVITEQIYNKKRGEEQVFPLMESIGNERK